MLCTKSQGSRIPDIVRRHICGSEVLEDGEQIESWFDLLRRYRDEWINIIAQAQRKNLRWANWFKTAQVPADEI